MAVHAIVAARITMETAFIARVAAFCPTRLAVFLRFASVNALTADAIPLLRRMSPGSAISIGPAAARTPPKAPAVAWIGSGKLAHAPASFSLISARIMPSRSVFVRVASALSMIAPSASPIVPTMFSSSKEPSRIASTIRCAPSAPKVSEASASASVSVVASLMARICFSSSSRMSTLEPAPVFCRSVSVWMASEWDSISPTSVASASSSSPSSCFPSRSVSITSSYSSPSSSVEPPRSACTSVVDSMASVRFLPLSVRSSCSVRRSLSVPFNSAFLNSFARRVDSLTSPPCSLHSCVEYLEVLLGLL